MKLKSLLIGVFLCIIFASTLHAKELRVAALFLRSMKLPAYQAIYRGLLKGKNKFNYSLSVVQNIDVGQIASVLIKYAKSGYDVIYADTTAIEHGVIDIARRFPKTKFIVWSDILPVVQNMAIFDSVIQEPAYLCGIIAAKLTRTGIVGVVGGYPLPEENRLIDAYIRGVKDTNRAVNVRVDFISSWFDPIKAKRAAIAQINYGADIIYSETYGAIEGCKERKVLAFGNFVDQNYLAPDTVITGPVWDFYIPVEVVTFAVITNTWTPMDLRKWTTMKRGGAKLAPFHSFARKLPQNLLKMIKEKEKEMKSGKS